MRISLKGDAPFKEVDLRGATAYPANIGRHEAHRAENPGGGDGDCEVFIITGTSSFVQVIATNNSGTDTAKACERALSVAKIIDPMLP